MNQTALIVIDGRRVAERHLAESVVCAAFDHFGIPWQVYDLGEPTAPSDFSEAARDPMDPPKDDGHIKTYVGDRALIVLAHDGAGSVSAGMAREIAQAVQGGAGLLCLDREVSGWPAELRSLLPATPGRQRVTALQIAREPHFITQPHEPGRRFQLDAELAVATLSGGTALVGTDEEAPIIAASRLQAGRVVFFGTGTELYRPAVFGHGRRLTGLLWRSAIWAARKPFATRSMPPMVSFRFDDCTGSYNTFDYVRELNRIGIRPNCGLFMDQLSEADWKAASELSAAGDADFSMHAFRDDLLEADPGWEAWGSMDHKPTFDEPAFHGFCMDHYSGAELAPETIRDNFATMDRCFEAHGVRHSRIINVHFNEVGLRALPFFQARGADILVNNGVPGTLHSNQPPWLPRPFGLRSPLGRHCLTIDESPDRSGMFTASVIAPPDVRHFMECDVLWAHTPFLDEAPATDMQGVLDRTIDNLHWALDAMAFGVAITHEQRVACVSPAEWRWYVQRLGEHLTRRGLQAGSREVIGCLVRRLFHSRLQRVTLRDGELQCLLTGQTDGPSPITIWTDDGAACRRQCRDLEAIDSLLEVRLSDLPASER